ncbi:MAG: phage tail tape measure protein, partial [Oscillospiraceae bacterium]|nr:phage tail tape measure protein [Oscillospiraceae bacterium]
MAENIGTKIVLEGEKEYRNALKQITQEGKTLKSEMDKVSSAYDKNGSSAKGNAEKQKVLDQQMENQKKKVDLLTSQYEKYSKELGENDTRTLKLKEEMNKATSELNNMNKGADEGQTKFGKFGAVMAEVGKKVGAAAIEIAKVGAAAIAAATAAAAGFAAEAVKVGMGFDSSMSQVAATMGYSVEQLNTEGSEAQKTFQQLRDFAQEMGASTAFSASEAADALNYMALAGYDADTSMQMLPNVLNLAAAGGMELAAASDMITDSQSALGLTIEETSSLVDMMARTSSKSNTSVAQLGEAILTVGGTAKTMHGGLIEMADGTQVLYDGTTELNAALGILADNGTKGAEGGTKLRNILLSLQAPTDKAAEMLNALGVKSFDAEG